MEPVHNKKDILIISGSFYPAISPRAFRTTELAKELSRQGHQVAVCFPAHNREYASFEQENGIQIIDLGRMRWKQVELKGGRLAMLFRRAARRFFQLLLEWPDIELLFKVRKLMRKEKGYDLLISVAVPYPIHWGVAFSRTKNRRLADCWVADCGDPYMGDTTDTFRKPFYFKYIEKYFCRKADYITIPFEGARSAYYSEFQHKIRIIPQGFRLDHLNLQKYSRSGDSPVFAYAGRFIPGRRDPGKLLAYLSTCERDFKFIVYTSTPAILLPYKGKLDSKLEIRENIEREKLLSVLSGMDFLVNFDNNTHTQLPSKLIDYAITNRPVFNVASSTDLSEILKFMDGDYGGKMALDPPENYDIRVVADKFLKLTGEN